MAQYTVLNDVDLQTILTHYPVGKVVSYKILSGGSENTNYLVNTENNAFVLTICEQKSQEEAKELASLLVYLQANKFATSKLQKTKNADLIVVWSDKPVMLKEFIQGDLIEDIPENLMVYLGRELAKLHQIKAPNYLSNQLAYGIEHFDEVQTYAPDSTFYNWLKSMKNYIENHNSVELPKSLIHSDIFNNNIIIDKSGEFATIMDFEEACYYYRVFDIGMMIVGTCCEKEVVNLHKVASLLKGYQQENKLLKIEIESLQAFTVYAATATAFWRHQNFNHINIIPEKKEHYLEMKLLADAIMNMPDGDFV